MIGREPNIQNIPIRTEQGRRIQEAFSTGHQLIEADYADLEVRAAAMSEPVVKIIGKADLECGSCPHVRGSVCNHPKWAQERKTKPLIIAEQGDKYPAFCPLERKA